MFKYLIILTLFLIVACTQNKVERKIDVGSIIEYREVLFDINDSLPTFLLNKKRILIDSLKANRYWFDDSYNIKYNWFRLKLNDRFLKVGANKFNPPPGVFPRDVIPLVVNRNNQFMLSMSHIDSIGKIDSALYRELNKSDFKFLEHLIFQWDEESNLEVIDDVFKEIENGYTLFYDSISRQNHGLPIHNLDLKQLQEIKTEYPFKVVILVKNRLMLYEEFDEGEFFQGFYYGKEEVKK